MSYQIHYGDNISVIEQLYVQGVQVDAIITDPPYGLSFMGREWDHGCPSKEFWDVAGYLLKPGGHVLSFGGTRMWHRMTCAIEDAGFEIRDCLMWLYGSGFPKSLDVSKAIDKQAGAEREIVGYRNDGVGSDSGSGCYQMNDGKSKMTKTVPLTVPLTVPAKLFSGYGTALKPAWEPIILAMKPCEGTFAENALKHGVAGLNVDAGRVLAPDGVSSGGRPSGRSALHMNNLENKKEDRERTPESPLGRWPANLLLDEESAEMLDRQSGISKSTGGRTIKRSGGGNVGSGKASEKQWSNEDPGFGDVGGASRFFYIAKASKKERAGSKHPTVKPLALMRYLCRLLMPPTGGLILDPFAGTDTTGEAAALEGFDVILIEKESQYIPDIEARMQRAILP